MRKSGQGDTQIETGIIQITFSLLVFRLFADTIKNINNKFVTTIGACDKNYANQICLGIEVFIKEKWNLEEIKFTSIGADEAVDTQL